MPDFLTPPDPSGSPLEKLELSRRTPNPRDLGRYLRMEGIDEDTARRMARAVEQWEREKFFDEAEGLLDLQTWANIHTHAGGGEPPPGPTYGTYLFVGGDENGEYASYEPSGNVWDESPANVAVPLRLAAGCSRDNLAYYFGGTGGQSAARRYDPVADSWSTLTALPYPNFGAGAAATDLGIHIVAGSAGAHHQLYDPGSNSYQQLAAFPVSTRYPGVAGNRTDKVYVFGGQSTTNAYVYDTSAEAWTQINSPVPLAGAEKTVQEYEGLFYIGDDTTGWWVYDPTADSYTQLSSGPSGLHRTTVGATANGKIVVAPFSASYGEVYIYDVGLDQWVSGANRGVPCETGGQNDLCLTP